jgi:hypothetical protein
MNLGLSLSNSSVVGRHADAVEKWRMIKDDDASTRERKMRGNGVFVHEYIIVFNLGARASHTLSSSGLLPTTQETRGSAASHKSTKKKEVIPKHSSFHHQLLSCFSVY